MARIDGAIGSTIESLVTAVHRRRLHRVGWARALNPPAGDYATAGPPPRAGNALEVLVDGASAFAAMIAAIRGARSHVHVTGWHLNPDFVLDTQSPPTILRELLSEAADGVNVRVLLWAGAPIRVFRPTRSDMRKVADRLGAGGRIKVALDARERPMHCHHDKTVVVDDRIAFVGGIDLTDFGGNRLDSGKHPHRTSIGWHDAASRLEGPAVQDVAEHFRLRWSATTGESLPAPAVQAKAGEVELQVVRTVPDGMYDTLPKGDFSVLEAYGRALRSAERLIYLENQFLWSPEIMSVLRDKLRRPPTPGFRLVILLPQKPNSGGDDTRGQLRSLIDADAGAGRLLACSLVAPDGGSGTAVYVHAKIGIVDDRWLTLGSANLNEHSLFNDTEVNIVTADPAVARATRIALWAEHLEVDAAEISGDTTEVVDAIWKPTARGQLERRRRGEPQTHRLVELEGASRRSGLLLGPIQGLLVDA